MADDLPQKKDECLRLYVDVDSEMKKLETLAQQVEQSARFTSDVLYPASEVMRQAPASGLSSEQWDGQIQGLKSLLSCAQSFQGLTTNINSFVAITNAVSNTAVSGVMTVYSLFPTAQPIPRVVETAKKALFQTLERFPLLDKAVASLRRLGLDKRPGNNAPMTLLQEARNALERPTYHDGSSVAVLVTLRECIDASITEMIRRQKTQEPVSGGWEGKVVSLGRRCALPSLPSNHFDRLGVEIKEVMKDLSGAKQQAPLPRDQLIQRFNRGLLTLNAILDCIDEKQLKPS